MPEPSASEVVTFWQDAGPEKWFAKDDGFDAGIRQRFLGLWQSAAEGRLSGWETRAESTLGLLILLDQFPRNMFRGTARAFASDRLARDIANRAIARGFDQSVSAELRPFFYLPLEHSETLADQERSLALFQALGDPENLKFARHHRDIIARFGRFPHRNAILGRESTPEELAFLEEDDFRG